MAAAWAFPSELGWMAIAGQGELLLELTFGHANPQKALAALQTAGIEIQEWNEPLAAQLQEFAAGRFVDFSEVRVDLEYLRTPFQRSVTTLCRTIPWGETWTYGKMASEAGSPRAARAVGNVMAANRTPLVVPCHRVVASTSNSHGGYSAGAGIRTKLRLLEAESGSAIAGS